MPQDAIDPPLARWPYAYRQLFRLPTEELIETHAILLLSHALNGGRVTAFVGSGASMAYGRISWNDLIFTTQDQVLRRYDALKGDPPPRIRKLAEMLRRHRVERDERNTNGQLIVFQLAEELDAAIDHYQQSTRNAFRSTISRLTFDDRGHAERILTDALERLKAPLDPLADIARMRADITRAALHPDAPPDGEYPLLTELQQTLSSPLHRYRALTVIRERRQSSDTYLLELHSDAVKLLNKSPDDTRASRRRPRHGRIDPSYDPLLIAFTELKISRYITTNYDHEIERLFFDLDYTSGPDQSAGNSKPNRPMMGASFREVVFSHSDTADLICCAIRDRSDNPFVVHLHGRAEADGRGSIVATDEDYRKHYIQNDERRALVTDAVRVAFGSSPILFMGIGMEEVDLLRPLREFTTGEPRTGERLVIALLPARPEKDASERQKIEFLHKYGVYTVHYGKAQMQVSGGYDQSASEESWLAVVRRKKQAVDSFFDSVEKGKDESAARTLLDQKIDRVDTPIRLEAMDVDDALRREISEINDAICYSKKLATNLINGAALTDEDRDLASDYRTILAGASNAVTTRSLSNWLHRARESWTAWQTTALRTPRSRQVTSGASPNYNLSIGAATVRVFVHSRHGIDLPSVDDEKRVMERFYAGAPSQTFNSLLSSLRCNEKIKECKGQRRLFLLVSPRGVGKGHFFAALQQAAYPILNEDGDYDKPRETARLTNLLDLIGPSTVKEYAVAFFNLSFSVEVTSVFDRLAAFLWDPTGNRKGDDDWSSLKSDRLGRLRYALKSLVTPKDNPHRRFIIAFNTTDVMFDGNGEPKNRQFRKIFDLLLHPCYVDIPVDLIFVCSHRAVPTYFRLKSGKSGKVIQLHHLQRRGISAKGRKVAETLISSLGIKPCDSEKRNFVHVLHQARASLVVNSFFPSVALLLAHRELRERGDIPKLRAWLVREARGRPNPCMQPTAWRIRQSLKRCLSAAGLGFNLKYVLPHVMLAAAIAFEAGVEPGSEPLNLGTLVELLSDEPNLTVSTLGSRLSEIVGKRLQIPVAELDELKIAFDSIARQIDFKLRELYVAAGHRRYAFTLWMAVVYEIFYDATASTGATLSQSQYDKVFQVHADEALAFLDRTQTDLIVRGADLRDDTIIEGALTRFRARHEQKRHQPLSELEKVLDTGLRLYDLQMSILWHLAVIGIPVEADVLAQCPLVRKALDQIKDGLDAETTVTLALDLLITRCLAFKLRPYQRSAESRYAIHRTVQRHIFRRMGAPFVEYTDVDQFSLTLYASQPNDIPRLSPGAHLDLQRTVRALSGFPGEEATQRGAAVMSPKKDLRSRMLRAAYGIVRSIYSVASLGRFGADYEEIERVQDGAMPFGITGLFEEHRRLIWWLLQEASRYTAEDKDHLSPFYSEEIVWLYNECGVLSLAQGKTTDALSLFFLADLAATTIEPDGTGPLRALILLNQSIVEIERGRLGSARRNLERIVARVELAEDPETHLIAQGYLGLVEHIHGNFKEAENIYHTAAGKLRELRRSRAASIFSRHSADLQRVSGDQHSAQAAVEESIRLAVEGRHEDMRHIALLSHARLLISNGGSANFGRVHAILSVVERYARAMEMPRLIAEIEEIRARVYWTSGDLTSAASSAAKSLEVCALHSLELRKVRGLYLLAAINLDRGFKEESSTLLDECLARAEGIQYGSIMVDAISLSQKLEKK